MLMLHLGWLFSHSGWLLALEHYHKLTTNFLPLHGLSPCLSGSIVYLPVGYPYGKESYQVPDFENSGKWRCVLGHRSLDTFGTIKISKCFLGLLSCKMLQCKNTLRIVLGLQGSELCETFFRQWTRVRAWGLAQDPLRR